MFVLRRTEDGKYVARPGSRRSYVVNLQSARVFPTREAAEAGKCGNEVIIAIVRGDGCFIYHA